MSKSLGKIAERLVGINLLWAILSPLSKLFQLLSIKRNHVERQRIINKSGIASELADLTILNGPFEGMKYPKARAIGGLLCAKLLGSYEAELHPLFEDILKEQYTQIVDVGCAEGYYAVGLARKFPEAKVVAYDTASKARAMCQAMADLNGAKNVEIRDFCSPEEVISLNTSGRSLIISDCESYEKELFTPEVLQKLSGCDLLIETHDFMDIDISQILEERMKKTHKVQRIQSIDDIQKAASYQFPETDALSLKQKRALFAEGRPSIMDWLWCQPLA